MKTKIKEILDCDKYISEKMVDNKLKSSIVMAVLIAVAFMILSIVNIIQRSSLMLYLTLAGFILEVIGAIIGYYSKKNIYPCIISVISSLILFTFFAIIGGNNGFAVLWIILFPCISIAMCDLKLSFCGDLYLLLFCIISFWTPLHKYFLYDYSSTFVIRFPLLYIVNLIFSIYLGITIKKSQYAVLKHEEELNYIKDFDKMTGVYNRSKFEEMLKNDIGNYETIGVGFFDVNNLKDANDNYGHTKGDFLIVQIAKVLTECGDVPHYTFRYGGDEFIVIIPNCSKEDCDNFVKICNDKMQELQELDSEINYSAAYGMSYGTKGYDIQKLISQADKKMYKQKQHMKRKM